MRTTRGLAVRAGMVLDGGLVDRHEVGDHHGARRASRRSSRGCCCGRGSAARTRYSLDGADLPVAAAPRVEDAAEERGVVEAGQAEPVDAAVGADQRGAAAVADEPVGGDRQVAVGALEAGAHRLRRQRCHQGSGAQPEQPPARSKSARAAPRSPAAQAVRPRLYTAVGSSGSSSTARAAWLLRRSGVAAGPSRRGQGGVRTRRAVVGGDCGLRGRQRPAVVAAAGADCRHQQEPVGVGRRLGEQRLRPLGRVGRVEVESPALEQCATGCARAAAGAAALLSRAASLGRPGGGARRPPSGRHCAAV